MAENPYPIPRETRQTDVLSGDGGATYGPFDFKIFDTEDVEVITRASGETAFSVASVTVTKLSGLALDHFTITFPAVLPATTGFQVRGRRVHERAAGVTSGTRLSPDALERELSKLAVTAEELRRDAPDIDPDIGDGKALIRQGGRIVEGPSTDQIAEAQKSAINAGKSEISAALSSASVGVLSGRTTVATFAEMETVFSYDGAGSTRLVAPGDRILVIDQNRYFQVAEADDLDPDLDYTGSGGIKLNIVPVHRVPLEAFGVVGVPYEQEDPGSGDNDTTAINRAILASSLLGIQLTMTPGRKYYATQIVLLRGAQIYGAANSQFASLSSTTNFMVLGEGAITDVVVDGVEFYGAGGVDQWGMYFAGIRNTTRLDEPAHGGLWRSLIRRCKMRNFGGCLWLRGGAKGSAADPEAAYDYLLPHQFLTIEDNDLQRLEGGNGNALRMTGQCAQIELAGRNRLDGAESEVGGAGDEHTGYNVVITREFANGGVIGGRDVGGAAVSDIAPTAVVFSAATTTQKAEFGYLIDRAKGIQIKGYFENLQKAVTAETIASISVRNCYFANAGSDGSGGGYLVRAGSGTEVDGGDNVYTGAVDKLVVGASQKFVSPNLIRAAGADAAGLTSGLTRDLSIDGSGAISAGGAESILVYSSATELTTINHAGLAGSCFTVKAQGGQIILTSGGNLTGLPNGRLVLRSGETATFQRQDVGGLLLLISVRKAQTSAAMPISGYYEAGELVHRTNFVPSGGAAPYLTGWRRLTTGTGHVLGTDWKEEVNVNRYRRVLNISAATAIFDLSSTYLDAADAHLLIVTGTDDTNRNRGFVDLVMCFGLVTPVVIQSMTTGLSPDAAARTYGTSGSDLTLAMASGAYSVRVVSVSAPTGDQFYTGF